MPNAAPHRFRGALTVRHLIVSRELAPASYGSGGIGTYVSHMAHLLAHAGETVHLIGERWPGAPRDREEFLGGRLVVHRVALDALMPCAEGGLVADDLIGANTFPAQRFAWNAAMMAEWLVAHEGIDVVEAQDWEAPLYYFLGRRARDLGPARQPPCVVHLHTPTEFVFRLNGWTPYRPEQLALLRMEEYCIGTADALLSPSAYMAREVAKRYHVPVEDIAVIPYPIGEPVLVTRTDAVWRDNRLLYVGRLEPRKGLIEFVDAAIDVARADRSVSYDFVGEDANYRASMSVRQFMERRIPATLAERFRFHGAQPAATLPRFLSLARASVIPSRGENYPNVCIEAMGSGLPVIASPNGGMIEMIDDGVTGWIAPSQSAPDLATALRRALSVSSSDVARMGQAAAIAIQERCGNERVLSRQIEWRAAIARRGATRSVGTSTDGRRVPVFTPERYVSTLAIRNIVRLPLRELGAVLRDAIRNPQRALSWLRAMVSSGEPGRRA